MAIRAVVIFCLVAFLVSFGFIRSGLAQEPVSSSPQVTENSDKADESVKKPFIITPSGTIELPKGTTTTLKAAIAEPPEGLRNSTAGVSLNGYIGYVPYEGKNLMVTVVDTVSKGDHTVSIPRRIEAQEYREKIVLSAQDEITLEVDPADLDAAIDALSDQEAEEDADKAPEPQEAKRQQSSAAPVSGGGGAGAGTSGNSLAGSYQNPTQQDFSDPQTEIRTSTDGCSVRIDQNQNMAIQTSKTQTFEDGKLVSESACTDSEKRYPLQKSFEGCTDIVDLNARSAFRQSQTYYSKDGARVTVSSCAKDTSATYAITEDIGACTPIIDQANRKVKIYAKLVYTGASNAQVVVRGCSPSTAHASYPLQQSFDSCSHKVDLPNKYAYARYKDYYIDKSGTRSEVSDCTVDTKKKWPIIEEEGSCKVFVDFTKDDEKVFKQSVMKYTDDQGVLNEARGCDKSTLTEPVPMVKDTHLCNIRHDFDNNESAQMFLWKYTLDGVAYQASACSDTDVRYPHKKYTIDASGGRVCPVKVDQDKRLVTLYYRVGIVVEDNVQYITECTPDSDTKLAVMATTDGCTDPASWQHDLANAVSYDNERWYYELNGTREYVTACQRGSKTYKHSETIVGWQLHDDKLYGFPMSKVTIDAPIGEYVVSLNTVLPGAVQQPYVLKETKNVLPTGSTGKPDSYEGCTGLFKTDKTVFYQRPDKTEYSKIVGKGEPIEEEICFEEFVEEKSFITKLRVVTSVYNYNNLEMHTTTYAKFRKYNKYTNENVTFAFEKRGSSSRMSGSSYTSNSYAVSIISQFNDAAGKFGGQKHPTFTPGRVVNGLILGQCVRLAPGTTVNAVIFSPFDCPSSINRGTLYTAIPDDSKVKW